MTFEQSDALAHAPERSPILADNKAARRDRSIVFEKAIKTVGTMTAARLLTVWTGERRGKTDLYDHLLCAVEELLAAENGRATLIVDGGMDSGNYVRRSHRALLLKGRRVIEDGAMRRSEDSQLLQMADLCAYAAFQSVLQNPNRDSRFHTLYEDTLHPLIVAPDGRPSRGIIGLDFDGRDHSCVSEHVAARGVLRRA